MNHKVTVSINAQAASKRTRSRVKESGPLFTFVKHGSAGVRSGEVLLRSVSTGWFGWLPLNEITLDDVDV